VAGGNCSTRQIGSIPSALRCRQGTSRLGRPRVELPGAEKGCCSQDFVSPPQLTVLPLQLPDPLPRQGGHSRSQTRIHLRPPDPSPQRLLGHPQLSRDRLNRCPPRGVIASVLPAPASPPTPAASAVPRRACHLSILSTNGVSNFPGAFRTLALAGRRVTAPGKPMSPETLELEGWST